MLKKYRPLWITIVVICLVLVLIQVPWNCSVDRAILKRLNSLDTPIPRTKSGKVDFIKIVDDMNYSPPEENFLADVISNLGSEFGAGSRQQLEFLNRLGIGPNLNRIEPVENFMIAEKPELGDSDNFSVSDLVENLKKPWTKEQFPGAYKWLKESEKQINQLASAVSNKPNYYHPMLGFGETDFLYGVLLAGSPQTTNAAQIITYRANFELGQGNIDAAIKDLAAIYAIGIKTQSGATLVEQLVGIAITGLAQQLLQEILNQPNLSLEQLASIKQSIPNAPLPSLKKPMSHLESWALMDFIQICQYGGGEDAMGIDLSNRIGFVESKLVFSRFTNWELAVDEIDHWNKRALAICNIENDLERLQSWEEYDSELRALDDAHKYDWRTSFRAFAGARSRGYLAGELLCTLAMPGPANVDSAFIRQKIMLKIARLSVATEEYYLNNQAYPKNLEALKPTLLTEIPIDNFTNHPMNFLLSNKCYVVYSLGEEKNLDVNAVVDGKVDSETMAPLRLHYLRIDRRDNTAQAQQDK